jgi:hypothetical protein
MVQGVSSLTADLFLAVKIHFFSSPFADIVMFFILPEILVSTIYPGHDKA